MSTVIPLPRYWSKHKTHSKGISESDMRVWLLCQSITSCLEDGLSVTEYVETLASLGKHFVIIKTEESA